MPNVNFVAGYFNNVAFREPVIDSHYVVVDGMPLVRQGRWRGLPVSERVAGSSVYERLHHTPLAPGQVPLRVFFFWLATRCGPQGGLADEHLIGWDGVFGSSLSGVGSVASMSTPDVLGTINATNADFFGRGAGGCKGAGLDPAQPPGVERPGDQLFGGSGEFQCSKCCSVRRPFGNALAWSGCGASGKSKRCGAVLRPTPVCFATGRCRGAAGLGAPLVAPPPVWPGGPVRDQHLAGERGCHDGVFGAL